MPKDKRKSSGHAPSVKLVHRHFALPEVAVGQLSSLETSSTSANEILHDLSQEGIPGTKKAKRQRKHEEFLDRLQSTNAPYSKSHAKRLKAKAKESLTAALGDMDHVLDAIKAATSESSSAEKTKPLNAPGRKVHLNDKQRAKVFEAEKSRHSAVLSDPGYRKNPFAAVRKHIESQTSDP